MKGGRGDEAQVILVAISQEWSDLVVRILEKEGYAVLSAASQDEAVAIVKRNRLDGIVMSTDWAVEKLDGQEKSLMEMAKGKIPTLAFIVNVFNEPLDDVYHPPMHEFATVPVIPEEIIGRLKRAMEGQKRTNEDI